ncbi:hypothetical protein CCMA1212_001188 [Trichoderma ghanense]|uniref:Uncharacterized protein n=1 Tax=Trichoderma ghanense TaxID=65468 RepID=A0ABY2HEV7_9HYPO
MGAPEHLQTALLKFASEMREPFGYQTAPLPFIMRCLCLVLVPCESSLCAMSIQTNSGHDSFLQSSRTLPVDLSTSPSRAYSLAPPLQTDFEPAVTRCVIAAWPCTTGSAACLPRHNLDFLRLKPSNSLFLRP